MGDADEREREPGEEADGAPRVETEVIKDLETDDGGAQGVRGGGDPQGGFELTT